MWKLSLRLPLLDPGAGQELKNRDKGSRVRQAVEERNVEEFQLAKPVVAHQVTNDGRSIENSLRNKRCEVENCLRTQQKTAKE
jgi:hypothetical protein